MSTPTITTSFTNPDPNQTISDLAGLVTVLNALVTSTINGTYTPYVTSETTPAVNDQDKIWFQLDSGGRPISVKKFYNGSWRRVFRGGYGEVRMFSGDPTNYFDGTGLGLPGLDWDGFALCNGQNGTPNLSNKFIVGAMIDNDPSTGYSSGWRSNVEGSVTGSGGHSAYTLLNNNLPSMPINLQGNDSYDNNGGGKPIQAIVTGKTDGNNKSILITTLGADPTGNPPVPQIDIPTVPPYFALAYVLWVGYA